MAITKPLHVTLVSNYFHPDYSATGQLLTELAVGLARLGCEVSVYTAQPVYGGRGRMPDVETHHGVRIRRVPSTRLDKDRRLGRILNAISFFLSAFWILLWRRVPGPLLIASNPPFMGVLGWLLWTLRGQRYVYLVHDVFPDLAVRLGFLEASSAVTRVWDLGNRLVVRQASKVVVIGDAMKALLARKAGYSGDVPERIHVIHNWVDEEFIRALPKSENWFVKENGLQDVFVVLYSGNIGLSQDLETVIEAAARLQDRNMLFLFVGDGGQKRSLESVVVERGLQNVRFLPYQPRDVLPYSATCGDVSILALRRGIEGPSMPSKLYTILASGRPAVAIVEKGLEVSRIIQEAGCGRMVEPQDVTGLVRVLDFYYSNPAARARDGLRGRRHFEANFTRTRACREYFHVLASVAG